MKITTGVLSCQSDGTEDKDLTDAWHKTKSDEEAKARSVDFWSRHAAELRDGQFWADRIKKLKGEPLKRLQLALSNLPLPASFREAAVATRALIREKRKTGEVYEEELALLYWLAAINSFSIPFSTVLQEPGYNVIESIPGNKLKELSFTYTELGYAQLELLNKTDIKWMTEAWGEPSAHTTLHEMHLDVWREYETKLKNDRVNEKENFSDELAKLSGTTASSHDRNKNYKWLLWLGMGIVILLIALFGK